MQWSKMFGGVSGLKQTSSTSDDMYQSQPPESYSAANTDSLNVLNSVNNLPFYGLDTLVKSNGYNYEELSTKSKKEKEQKANMKSWKAICHILSHK